MIGEAAAIQPIRVESERAFFLGHSRLYQCHVVEAIFSDVVFKVRKYGGVRLKRDDAGLWIDVLEIKDGHSNVAATIQDSRVCGLRREVIQLSNEKILAQQVEVRAVVDPDAILIVANP